MLRPSDSLAFQENESNNCEKIDADLSMMKKISQGYTALDVKESLRNKRQKECIIYLEKMTGRLTMVLVLILTGIDIKSL